MLLIGEDPVAVSYFHISSDIDTDTLRPLSIHPDGGPNERAPNLWDIVIEDLELRVGHLIIVHHQAQQLESVREQGQVQIAATQRLRFHLDVARLAEPGVGWVLASVQLAGGADAVRHTAVDAPPGHRPTPYGGELQMPAIDGGFDVALWNFGRGSKAERSCTGEGQEGESEENERVDSRASTWGISEMEITVLYIVRRRLSCEDGEAGNEQQTSEIMHDCIPVLQDWCKR